MLVDVVIWSGSQIAAPLSGYRLDGTRARRGRL